MKKSIKDVKTRDGEKGYLCNSAYTYMLQSEALKHLCKSPRVFEVTPVSQL